MDYIQRLLNQVTKMLAMIVAHRRAGHDQQAEAEIEKSALQTAGLPMSLIMQASPQALRAFLETGGAQRHVRDILLAELLLQQAELSAAKGQEQEMRSCKEHAFCLIMDAYELLAAEDAGHYRAKLELLAAAVHDPDQAPPNAYLEGRLQKFASL